MFFILSKVLDFLISPIFWVLIALGFALFAKQPKRKKKSLVAAFLLLIFFTNPFIINQVMHSYEARSYRIDDIKRQYDVAIVLGGATRYFNSETVRPVYGNAVDRLIQAVDLYKSQKVKKILLTGGSGYLLNQNIKESDLLRNVLLTMAVLDSDIIVENQSRNTYENAKMTADILKTNNFGSSYLVITSAFHVPRTRACFDKQNIDATYYPVDEHSGAAELTPDKLFVPNEGALNSWNLLVHEWIGLLSYKIAGYI
jgi:uncharacterized SAM-binding protein YcdF (DUF218 family)